jgi:ribonuclease BN (tRNA processing enzyme)
MKLTILGIWGDYPEVGEATSGYLLEHEGFKYLIDCGSGVLSLLQKTTHLHELDAVLISHDHYDNIADLGCLQYASLTDTNSGKRNRDLQIYLAGGRSRHKFNTMPGSLIHPIWIVVSV